MFGFGIVKVSGPSMTPTFNDGDWLFIKWSASGARMPRLKIGKIVLIERRSAPGVYLIKRIKKIDRSGELDNWAFWVEGDNTEGNDSRKWGWISQDEICGRIICRYRKSQN